MASEVTSVVIGDYRYHLYDDQTALAVVTNRTKTSYGALQASVTHQGVTYALTSLGGCFSNCYSLTTAPEIPDGVTDMGSCFYSCSALTAAPSVPSGVTKLNNCFENCGALTTAPAIPSSVTNINVCFRNCSSLTTAPSIPSSVRGMAQCFEGCTSLTGTIAVHGTPTYYDRCFYTTTQPITLEVSLASELPTWRAIAATGNNGNVSATLHSANPAPTATITAVRVLSRGSTTPDETGQYAYVTVRTTASTEQAPDNVAQAPTITLDGATYTPLQPTGTATFTCWVSLGNDLGHVIGATPRDTYKTGTSVTVTLASTYSPMEFHATPVYDEHGELKGYIGGDGAAFGQHATRAGWLDVAWNMDVGGDADVHGDVSADGALSCADGSPYCSDGTNVVVGGTTVGSADNLSYVASTDTIRAPTRQAATRNPSTTAGGSIWYMRMGRLVIASFTLNVTTLATNTVVGTGLPIATSNAHVAVAAGGNKAGIMYVSENNGNLIIESSLPSSAYYVGTVTYISAS